MVALGTINERSALTASGTPIEWPPPSTIDAVGLDKPAMTSEIASPASTSPPRVFMSSSIASTFSSSSSATRAGIIEKIDSIVATAPRKEVAILDLTGEDTVNTVVAKVEPKVEKPKVESKIEPKVVQKEQPKAEPKVVQKEQPKAEPKAPLNYHVIVASFPTESLAEAEKYVARLKKETSGAKLVVTESRVRVAYSSHPSMAIATEARDALAETQSKYKDCWVLKRVL